MAYRLQSNMPPLTEQEERECFEDLRSDSKVRQDNALDRLVKSNLRLVFLIAKEFSSSGLEFEELTAEGVTGLLHATDKFDPTKGVKFISYAAWWIRQRMRLAIQNNRTVRMPAKAGIIRAKLLKGKTDFMEDHDREPTAQELAEITDLPMEAVLRVLNGLSFGVSLDGTPDDDEDGRTLEEILDVEDETSNSLEDAETMEAMKKAVRRLSKRDQVILSMRFGLEGKPPATLEEVAQEVGRCRERCRQLQTEALKNLRKTLKKKGHEK